MKNKKVKLTNEEREILRCGKKRAVAFQCALKTAHNFNMGKQDTFNYVHDRLRRDGYE